MLYVNLELDRASCLHRFKDVYMRLNWPAASLHNIDIWNLRGNAVPMDQLAPKLIRRAAQKNYLAVIIDPIYKVITGDENSAWLRRDLLPPPQQGLSGEQAEYG